MLRLLTFGMRSVFVFVAAAAIWTSVNAQTFTGSGFTIVDGDPEDPSSCSTINVSGVTGNRFLASVSLIGIHHTFIGDLEVRLYAPGGTVPPDFGGGRDFILLSTNQTVNCNFGLHFDTLPPSPPVGLNYRFTDVAATSIDSVTTPCISRDPVGPPFDPNPETEDLVVPAGDYRASNASGANISLFSTFGTLIPSTATDPNGDWFLCVYDFEPGDTGAVASTSLQLGITPTAASVSVSGQVIAGKGQGLSGATIRITDASGNSQTTLTNSFGIYSFNDVQAGSVYTVSVSFKGYTFDPSSIVLPVEDDVSDVNFAGVSTKRGR